MDREKVMNWLTELAKPDWKSFHSISEVQIVAQDALELLKEQEHKDKMFHALEDDWKRLKALLKELQPKTGNWLKKMSNYPSAIATGGSRTSACDLCGGWGRKTFKYCPHCGAKMEGR